MATQLNFNHSHLLRYLLILVITVAPLLPQLAMATRAMAGVGHAGMTPSDNPHSEMVHAAMSMEQTLDAQAMDMECGAGCASCSDGGQCYSVAIVSDIPLLIAPMAESPFMPDLLHHRSANRVPEPYPPRTR